MSILEGAVGYFNKVGSCMGLQGNNVHFHIMAVIVHISTSLHLNSTY